MTDAKKLSVVICTHNRHRLLKQALDSLQSAHQPAQWQVEILVMANACDDGTHAFLDLEKKASRNNDRPIPVDWMEVPTPGKSHALNAAIPKVRGSDLVAFVDDDHQVDQNFLVGICRAAERFPQASLFCGRILPAWDGSEPSWVHDEGPYRIRPLPIPRSDGGPESRELGPDDPTPGGGNLFLRGEVFARAGNFPAELGPHGHDLGGGEDSVFIERALAQGERLFYVPEVVQYHYVDPARLRFGYVLRKAFQRARSNVIAKNIKSGIPLYQWRKLSVYLAALLVAFKAARLRFYAVRLATTLGEIAGQWQSRWRPQWRPAERRRNQIFLTALTGAAVLGLALAFAGFGKETLPPMLALALAATGMTALLAIKSILDFTHTGPRLPREILDHYRHSIVLSFLRLLVIAFCLLVVLAAPGLLTYFAWLEITQTAPRFWLELAAALASISLLSLLQFSRHLLLLPANLAASYNYRISRLFPWWRSLSRARLGFATGLLLGMPMLSILTASLDAFLRGQLVTGLALACAALFYSLLGLWLRPREAKTTPSHTPGRPNVILIGSDTLRADRVDGSYRRKVAPFLRKLADQGVFLSQCHVPCARTAPSLLSLMTGLMPCRLGVRDNFVPDETTRLKADSLAVWLKSAGYSTAVLSDWCGADFGKFDLGFDYVDVPEDQWNIHLFIRQGPKDLRLFLSLFVHNVFGRMFLPEIYYLGGVPKTDQLGREARHLINFLAERNEPFFLNLFFSTTHGPFGSEYPYYIKYADPDYEGESKFVMARLTDPWEIIRRQAEPKEAFDLDQIIDLYDGCVRRFDDEVKRLKAHLEATGLAKNTLVIIYSDHGMEFFEQNTWGQGNSAISDVSSRIPIIIHGPGIPPREISKPTCSTDLAPTLLDLLGLAGDDQTNLDGQSLGPEITGTGESKDRIILGETGIWLTDLPGTPKNHLRYPNLIDLLTVRNLETGTISIKPDYEPLVIAAKDRWVRLGCWKLVYQPLENGYRVRLFDLEADPICGRDLAKDHPRIVTRLLYPLQIWLENESLPIELKDSIPAQQTMNSRQPYESDR